MCVDDDLRHLETKWKWKVIYMPMERGSDLDRELAQIEYVLLKIMQRETSNTDPIMSLFSFKRMIFSRDLYQIFLFENAHGVQQFILWLAGSARWTLLLHFFGSVYLTLLL